MSWDCENTTSVHVSGVGMVRNGQKITSRPKQQTVTFRVLMVAGCNRNKEEEVDEEEMGKVAKVGKEGIY